MWVAVFVDARPELIVNGMQCAHDVIDVAFQFCCIFHGVSFTVVMAQSYQKSIEDVMQKTEKTRAS